MDWDAFNRNTKRDLTAIVCGFFGMAFIGGGMGGVADGDPSGWIGVLAGGIQWFVAIGCVMAREDPYKKS